MTRSQGAFRSQQTFSSEVSPNVNAIWFADNAQVGALSTFVIDFQNLSQTLFGTQVPVNFESICAIYVRNRSTSLTLSIENGTVLDPGTTQPPHLPITLIPPRVQVPPGGVFCVTNPNASWSVSVVPCTIGLRNYHSSSIPFDVVITGRKTTSENQES